MVNGAIGSSVNQGMGVAIGLQHSFGWTSVAAARIGNGVFGAVSGSGLLPNGPRFSSAWDVNQAASGLASGFAHAATRSLITGSDFGDNFTAALPDIIGQTVGNIIAGQEQQASQAGGNSASAPGSAAGPASSDPIGDLNAEYAGPTAAELASGQWSNSAIPTASAPTDSTALAEVVVTAQRNSSYNSSGYNSAYFQYINNINGGRHTPSPLNHFLYAPFPGIPSQANNILQRTLIYGSLNQLLNSPGSVYNTSFFDAASNVTGIAGLSGAQYLSLVTDTVGSNYPYDPTTLNNVEALGEGL